MTSFRARNQLSSWWARRWLETLSLLDPKPTATSWYGWNTPNRREQGFTLARTGRVTQATLVGTTARALVTDREVRTSGCRCSLTLTPFDEATWGRLVPLLAARSQVEAALLSEELPLQVEALVKAAGASLFPRQAAELTTSCDGPYCEKPLCPHVAALHYVLGDLLERDPFVLFELRGRPRAWLLAAMRAHRRGGDAGTLAPGGVSLASLLDHSYDAGRGEVPALPSLPLSGRLVDTLAVPRGWSEGASPALLLGPAIGAAAQLAAEVLTPRPPERASSARKTRRPGEAHADTLRRVGVLADLRDLTTLVSSLLAVSLGLEARCGLPAPDLLDLFTSPTLPWARLDARGGSQGLHAWREHWTQTQLERPGELILALDEMQVGARRAGLLWRLDEDRPRIVRWWSEPAHPTPRWQVRRRMLEALDARIPRDRIVTLVADLESCGAMTWQFLVGLGWEAVLRCSPTEPIVLSRLTLPQPLEVVLPIHGTLHDLPAVSLPRLGIEARRLVATSATGELSSAISDWTGVPTEHLLKLAAAGQSVARLRTLGVTLERRVVVAEEHWLDWLTLFVVSHELLAVMGAPGGELGDGLAQGDQASAGLRAFLRLSTMPDEEARGWLLQVSERLRQEPALMARRSEPRGEPSS